MQLFSSPKATHFSPLFPTPNPNPSPKSLSPLPLRPLPSLPLLRSPPSSASSPLRSDLDERVAEAEEEEEEEVAEGALVVRRPVKEFAEEGGVGDLGGSDGEGGGGWGSSSSSKIDRGLSEFAKKMPIFEPERVGGAAAEEKPLPINLELGLYRAKVLTRSFEFREAEEILVKCIKFWPEDGRAYVALGKLFSKQSRFSEARAVYEKGCQATQGENSYIWQAWAQVELQQENNFFARQLFEKAVQASPKNRFAWHIWALFEAKQGDVDKGRKLLKIGHAVNPKDPVLLQSLALLEYRHLSANLARILFRKASKLDPKHQPVWIAWGWMEWKEGNISTARELYQRALSIDSTSESAARCLQAWGVLEQRIGNLSVARRLFRSSLNINSQSYITWMTWASLEEKQGNPIRAEEIRNLYFQQRTEVVDDASWIMGFLDIIDPALDSIKRLLKFDQTSEFKEKDATKSTEGRNNTPDEASVTSDPANTDIVNADGNADPRSIGFDLDAFIREKLSLDPSELDKLMESSEPKKIAPQRKIWRSVRKTIHAET